MTLASPRATFHLARAATAMGLAGAVFAGGDMLAQNAQKELLRRFL